MSPYFGERLFQKGIAGRFGGDGRRKAAGINNLPHEALERFQEAFMVFFSRHGQ